MRIVRKDLVEVDVVVKRDETGEGGGAEESDGDAADGEEDEGHVELEGLGGALGGEEAVAHDGEGGLVFVLEELPEEEGEHGGDPGGEDPEAAPVVVEVVEEIGGEVGDGALPSHALQVLAQGLACVAQSLAVVEVSVLLEKKCLQLP